MPRSDTATNHTDDALDAVLNAVADPDAKRWLEAMLTRGEAVMVPVADRPPHPHAACGRYITAASLTAGYRSGRSLGQRLSNIEHNLRSVVGVSVSSDSHKKQKVYTFWPLRVTTESGGIAFSMDSAKASV